MPTGQPHPVQLFPAQIQVPTESGLFVSVSVQSDGTPEITEMIPGAVQEIVDLLQGWAGRHPQANVEGQLYDVMLSAVTPTDPIPVLAPEEGPVVLGEDESPSAVV